MTSALDLSGKFESGQDNVSERGSTSRTWSEYQLSDLSAFITKGSTPTTYGHRWAKSGILFLRSECVSENGLDLRESMFISTNAHASIKRSEVQNGDILVTITGNVGRVVRFEGCDVANINQHIARIRISNNQADAEYVRHYLSRSDQRRLYYTITTGQAYPQLSLQQVRQTLVRLPELKEQKAIAAALSDAEELIKGLEAVVAKKRALKQGAMQDLFSGRKRLPGFKGEWQKRTFSEVFDFFPTATNSRADLSPDGDAYYVHYGDIHTRFNSHLDFTVESVPKISRTLCQNAAPLKNGDWIMADASEDFDGVGKSIEVSGLERETIAVSGLHTFLLREKSKTFAPGFKGHLGNSSELRRQYMRVMSGMKVYGVSKAALKDLILPIPELVEQIAITEILNDLDAGIEAVKAKLDKARQIKRGMMQELLTGRVRLV